MIYGVDTKMNSRGKVISSCFENYKTTMHSFFYTQTFICHTRLRFDSNNNSHVLKGFKRKVNIVNERLAE